MSGRIVFCVLTILVGSHVRTVNAEQQVFLWGIIDAAPFHITDGKYAHQGLCDALVKEIINKLPELNHVIKVFPHTRLSQMIEGGNEMCFPCVIKRAHSDRFVFSDATSFYPPHGVIALSDVIESRFPQIANSRLSVNALTAQRSLIFAFGAGRRYPQPLQELVDRLPERNKVVLSGRKGTVRVLQSISKRRVDLTLDYPAILRYYQLNEGDNSLSFFQVEEVADSQVFGAIGCPINDWGRHKVGLINKVLPEVLASSNYIAVQSLWHNLDEQSMAAQLRTIIETNEKR